MSRTSTSTACADNPLHDLRAQLESLVSAQVAAKTSELKQRELAVSQREKILEKTLRGNSERVTFSIGGQVFELAASTLAGLPSTWFEGVLSPNFKRADDGVVFVDRDPDSFRVIVDFIRYGVLPSLDDPILFHKVKADADYYSFDVLRKALRAQSRRTVVSGGLSCSAPSMAGPTNNLWNWVVTNSGHSTNGSPGFSVNSGVIRALREGTYILNMRALGHSSGNNGYAQLLVDDTAIAEAWSGNASGYYGMVYFNEILQLREGAEIKIAAMNLYPDDQGYYSDDERYRPGTGMVTSLHLTPVGAMVQTQSLDDGDDDDDTDESKAKKVEYIRLEGKGCAGMGKHYIWSQPSQGTTPSGARPRKQKVGQAMASAATTSPTAASLFLLQDASGVRVTEAGRYLVMVRVGGSSSNNTGYAELRKSDVAIAQAWSGQPNGDKRSMYFNEVLSLAAGDTLKVFNVNLQYALDTSASFNVLRLGC